MCRLAIDTPSRGSRRPPAAVTIRHLKLRRKKLRKIDASVNMNELYLKYKEDRINTRLLSDLKKHNWLINKVAKRKDDTEAKGNKSPPKDKESLLVSIPLDIFHNLCRPAKRSAPAMEKLTNEDFKFKVPKLLDVKTCPDLIRSSAATPQLRMARPLNKKNIPASKDQPGEPNTGSSKSCTVTSNILLNKVNKNKEKIPPVNRFNNLNTTSMIPPEKESTISLKHKLPVTAVPAKGNYRIVPKLQNTATEANKCTKLLAEANVQTDEVFVITEDESKILGVITSSRVTKEELTKLLDSHKKFIEINNENNETTTEIIDLEKDDVIHNVNQDTLKMALFHSQNNKNLLLSEMTQYNNSNVSQASEMPRPTRAGTPFPFFISPPAVPSPRDTHVHHSEIITSLRQIAQTIIALSDKFSTSSEITTKKADKPQTNNIQNISQNIKETQSVNRSTNTEEHYNNLEQLAAKQSQQKQYNPQIALTQRKEQLKHQMPSAQQQTYLQIQQPLQYQQPEIRHRYNLQNPSETQLHWQIHSVQQQSPLQLQQLQFQADRSLYEEQQACQNEILFQQQKHFVPQQPPPHMQYAQAASDHRSQSKQIASKTTKQLVPGDPRHRSLQDQLDAPKRPGRVMSMHAANMRCAQPPMPRPNYELQYQQYYQNQYWQ